MKLRWRLLTGMHAAGIPPGLREWLGERDSLTRRLRLHCHGQLTVRVRRQAWHRPSMDEAQCLELPQSTVALIREVYLLCDNEVRVYARSVIPLATLAGPLRRLKYLGTRPLGDLLFADPDVARRPIEITAVPRSSLLFSIATAFSAPPLDELWGRRSVFHLQSKPLLVSEFFLPGLCQK